MEQGISFGAPWGASLKAMSALSVAILLGVAAAGVFTGPPDSFVWKFLMIAFPLVTLVVAVFFSIRGYVLTPGSLLVLRPGWTTRLDLSGLVSAEADPKAMAGSIRTFGNGGMFSFTGKYRNKKLGPYRAFVTDQKRSVVLRFESRVVVVTPDSPEKFVACIGEMGRIR